MMVELTLCIPGQDEPVKCTRQSILTLRYLFRKSRQTSATAHGGQVSTFADVRWQRPLAVREVREQRSLESRLHLWVEDQ
jgi:hypothetical protein